MATGESRSDISKRLTNAKGHTLGTTGDRQRAYLITRCIAAGKPTTGSVADLQVRLGLPVREILKSGDIT